MESCVYMITCTTNGKVYIGQSKNVGKRRYEHLRQLRNGEHHSTLLQADYDRFGEAAFTHEVIQKCSIFDVDQLEKKLIKERQSNNPDHGYNLCSGGNRNKFHHEITREKIRKIALSQKRWQGENNPNYGGVKWDDARKAYYSKLNAKYWTVENRIKHKAVMKKVYNFEPALQARRKKVAKLDLQGKYVESYDSVTAAAQSVTNNQKGTAHISDCCNEKRRSAYGHIWVYMENYEKGKYKVNPSNLELFKTAFVAKYDINDNLIEVFPYRGIHENKKGIWRCITGEIKTSKGFKYRLYQES